MKQPKPSRRSVEKFGYFSQCKDTKRLPEIPRDDAGFTASECFHARETSGLILPCREPELFSRALNGKERHGITVTMCAEDYVDRLLFASEIKANYPEWVQKDILGRARQVAIERLGYVPTFVKTGEDFTTLKTEKL